jgi:hypothetical protein
MSREPLPPRRNGETIRFAVERRGVPPVTYFATIGYYPDGRIGEVFLSSGKIGSDLEIACRDAAIAFSFALQHGCSLATARAAFCRDEDGRPEGPLGTLLDILTRDGDGPVTTAPGKPTGPQRPDGTYDAVTDTLERALAEAQEGEL